jgi:hypothetical protein
MEIMVSIQTDLKSYSDIRKHVPPAAFVAGMSYISWHNRLSMTDMLETWQALVVTLAFERRSIDGLLFSGVKSFLDTHLQADPQSLAECQTLADQLIKQLFPNE